jgi:alkanesulfonate monooxygenase SsuD/methylene tetrahydromethanopterin reductase-like flavin-dependent oxidoreductase (luciferase family)
MEFGISLFPTVEPADKSGADYFAEALRLAELADDLGYHHVKTVEHYFFGYGGYSPDPITFLAAAAARTRRVRLVTGAVVPAFTHPIKLAGQLAMLDTISHGRLDVGFGRAFLPDEFAAFGIPMDESHGRFREGVEACRALWSGEEVTWDGEFHRFGPVRALPVPVQRPHPPVLVASSITAASCEAAGRAGFGLMMVPSINKLENAQEMLATYRAARAAAGHEGDGAVHASYNCFIADDPAEALARGRACSARTNELMVEAVSAWGATTSADYAGYQRILDKVRSTDVDRQVREARALIGSPDQVADAVGRIREWFGEITLSLQVVSGNPTFAESARTMELFAEHVMPQFATPPAAPAAAAA